LSGNSAVACPANSVSRAIPASGPWYSTAETCPEKVGTAPRCTEPATVRANLNQTVCGGDDIVTADEASNKGTGRRSKTSRGVPLIHDHHQIGQGNRLVLTVRDMDKGDAARRRISVPR
jgi:hypothetical protein